jgi:uncharacterized RDD family membrane protein YckC
VEPEENKAGAGARILALIIGIALLFGAAVMAIVVINPDDIPLCSETAKALAAGECFDISETQNTISTILAVPAGILAAIAGLLGFYVAFTGRRADLMMKLGGAAVALGVLTYIINTV